MSAKAVTTPVISPSASWTGAALTESQIRSPVGARRALGGPRVSPAGKGGELGIAGAGHVSAPVTSPFGVVGVNGARVDVETTDTEPQARGPSRTTTVWGCHVRLRRGSLARPAVA